MLKEQLYVDKLNYHTMELFSHGKGQRWRIGIYVNDWLI